MKKSIVLIDFCGTVVDFQTLNPFLELVLRNKNKIKYYLLCNSFVKLICKIASKVFCNCMKVKFLYKAYLVWLLKGISEDEFIRTGREYYNNTIHQHLIPESLAILKAFKDKGYESMIVSGGSKYYISHFAEEFGIDHCLTAEIDFKDGICTGKILRECMLAEKVELIKEFVKKSEIDCVFKAGMTDSRSDMPMLGLCEERLIISCQTHQRWVTDDMTEIIY